MILQKNPISLVHLWRSGAGNTNLFKGRGREEYLLAHDSAGGRRSVLRE